MNKYIALMLILAALGLGFSTLHAQTVPLTVVINSPAANQSFPVNQAVSFSAQASGGNPGNYAYVWDFGDGTFGAGQNYSKTYTATGQKTISVTVTDFVGTQTTISLPIIITGVTPPPTITVDLKANGQDSLTDLATSTAFTLSWTSGNATACNASGAWSGVKALNGTESVESAAATGTTRTYTLTCNDASNNSAANSVSVTTIGGNGTTTTTLTISNVRVTDITTNSVVVRWETNLPASSRVLYDTVSHASVSGQAAPNYGYADSTGTTDVDTKVTEHAVSVGGLSASTTYFFRAVSEQ